MYDDEVDVHVQVKRNFVELIHEMLSKQEIVKSLPLIMDVPTMR